MSLQEELQMSKLPAPGVQLMLQLMLTREAVVRDPKDRRVSRVVITPKGRRLMERLDEPVQEMATRLTSCCDEAECLNMANRLERLREHCSLQEGAQEELVGAAN